jgi:hypothetical protein
VEHPYSALNLRLVLATFGLITSGVLAALLLRAEFQVLGWACVALAVVAAIDLVVIQRRRRARRRADSGDHSLFE